MKKNTSLKHSTRWIISVKFPDGKIKYLAGHNGTKSPAVFTGEKEKAVSSRARDNLKTWFSALNSYNSRFEKIQAVIHKANEAPKFRRRKNTYYGK